MKGLFVGLTTLDCLYLAERLPQSNEKILALDQLLTVGGPATNAAIAFAHWGHQTELISGLGQHFLSGILRQELANYGVHHRDLTPEKLTPPSISSVIITQATGERAVISLNATQSQVSPAILTADILDGVDIVLIDGHQLAISGAIAAWAKAKHIPVILDGGSWKPGLETVLPYIDYGICSANFLPPGCQELSQIITFLQGFAIPYLAITQGDKPTLYFTAQTQGAIPSPEVNVVDTLGAGDILHGVFAQAILDHTFPDALAIAVQVASASCQFFGPRQWLTHTSHSSISGVEFL